MPTRFITSVLARRPRISFGTSTWRVLLYGGAFCTLVAIVGGAWVLYVIWGWQRQLPDHSYLLEYEPPMQTRVYAGDGALLAEYGRERRFHIPYDAIPDRIIHAFLSAEDQNFFRHRGIDPKGILRAMAHNLSNLASGRRLVGASTITQQVAKNFLLSREVSLERKSKEILLALSIERALPKERILELYLNEIYLGFGSYGIAAAAFNYFNKSLDELTIAEIAYLAALAKGPANYHPVHEKVRALDRRNWVVSRMYEEGYISDLEATVARSAPLEAESQRKWGAQLSGAGYFVEEIRRELHEEYGEKDLYEAGMLVRSTLSPRLQKIAQRALRSGLVAYDRRHGWRGEVTNISADKNWRKNWQAALGNVPVPEDLAPWRLAVVLEAAAGEAKIGLLNGRRAEGIESGVVPFEEVEWAAPWIEGQITGPRPEKVSDVLDPGDVIYVEAIGGGASGVSARYTLRQLPEVNGALVALDPFTGRVLAMQGGFSHALSEFNRAHQALRQTGSAFKPFVYAVALEKGYTPASILLDAPVAIDPGEGLDIWKPENYTRKFYGPSTLRKGIEHSRNVMTVRLAHALGIDNVARELRDFDLVENFPPLLSMALGAGESSLMRMASGYATFVNGGRKVELTLIDRIQDRYGKTLHRFDSRRCSGCSKDTWRDSREPVLHDERPELMTPQTAYQIVSMLEGVVQRGTATSLRSLPHPVAGKTGTTNEERDAWFFGFSSDLVVGVYIGFDEPRPLGNRETGGNVAAPVFQEFMARALEGQHPVPFRVPSGIRLMHIDSTTGEQVSPGSRGSILEAFKLDDSGPNTPSGTGFDILNDDFIGGGETLPGQLFQKPGQSLLGLDDDA